jgi:hypothetical protein
VKDHLSAQGPHRLDLHRVGLLGHADHRPHAEQVRSVGNRLAVIAGRGGDDTPPPLVRGQLADQVHPAADLEGAHRLMVLVLDPRAGPGHGIERWIAVQRRRLQVGRDALTRSQDVSQVRHTEIGHAMCLPRPVHRDKTAGQPDSADGPHARTVLPDDHRRSQGQAYGGAHCRRSGWRWLLRGAPAVTKRIDPSALWKGVSELSVSAAQLKVSKPTPPGLGGIARQVSWPRSGN